MSQPFFLQMSGAPGSGKTTIAQAVGKATSAVVIDHDITKSALLTADVPVGLAGRASYQVLHAVADHLLQQGHSVIFDSPCFYDDLLTRGQQFAAAHGVRYRYIECIVRDLDELDRRLKRRHRLPSQVAGVYAAPTAGSGKDASGATLFQEWIANMKRPPGEYLPLDTAQPIALSIEQAIAYIVGK